DPRNRPRCVGATPAGMGRRRGTPGEEAGRRGGGAGRGARPRHGMTAPAFGRFFLPGPTDVHPDVLAAMQHAMIGHRSSAMERLLQGLEQPLARLFRTSRTVLVGTTSAAGVMEMRGRSGVRPRSPSLLH